MYKYIRNYKYYRYERKEGGERKNIDIFSTIETHTICKLYSDGGMKYKNYWYFVRSHSCVSNDRV